jgi:hypothetical protein
MQNGELKMNGSLSGGSPWGAKGGPPSWVPLAGLDARQVGPGYQRRELRGAVTIDRQHASPYRPLGWMLWGGAPRIQVVVSPSNAHCRCCEHVYVYVAKGRRTPIDTNSTQRT